MNTKIVSIIRIPNCATRPNKNPPTNIQSPNCITLHMFRGICVLPLEDLLLYHVINVHQTPSQQWQQKAGYEPWHFAWTSPITESRNNTVIFPPETSASQILFWKAAIKSCFLDLLSNGSTLFRMWNNIEILLLMTCSIHCSFPPRCLQQTAAGFLSWPE